ncbi:unnamed protein product [Strongylus vulgaris]|uniref:non-specific serine/threonine protein kinase n=1 Tax=Strongylus vulgaris TaxID=40348 RepID=A0A3P7I7U3_STRVU|nr:unnamed protein product [Strongylus vulgaris]
MIIYLELADKGTGVRIADCVYTRNAIVLSELLATPTQIIPTQPNAAALVTGTYQPPQNGGEKTSFHGLDNGAFQEAEVDSTHQAACAVTGPQDGIVSSKWSVSLSDFRLLTVIGRGSYAKVVQAEHIKTKQIYAIKIIKKQMFNEDEDIDWVQTEKSVFEAASNYPFLVGLHSCFQTESRLFFVIEFVPGGDLMFHMQRQRKLPEDHARFYQLIFLSLLSQNIELAKLLVVFNFDLIFDLVLLGT